MENKKYYEVKKKYLAFAISFLGFQYYTFDKEDGKKLYTFEDTESFRKALTELSNLKRQFDYNFNFENNK